VFFLPRERERSVFGILWKNVQRIYDRVGTVPGIPGKLLEF
jgi:hypothetical protein